MKKFFISVLNKYFMCFISDIERWILVYKIHKKMISMKNSYDSNYPRLYAKVHRDYKSYMDYYDFINGDEYKKHPYFQGFNPTLVSRSGVRPYLNQSYKDYNKLSDILSRSFTLNKKEKFKYGQKSRIEKLLK